MNSGATTWIEIARTLATLLGVDPDGAVEGVPFASLVAPAPRPQYPTLVECPPGRRRGRAAAVAGRAAAGAVARHAAG